MKLHLDSWWENDRENENTPKFPSFEIWIDQHSDIWIMCNVFIK